MDDLISSKSENNLPGILLIGDSIRMGYQSTVMKMMEGKAQVFAPEENCQYSGYILEHMEEWREGRTPAIIHFNAGLHDIFRDDEKHCRYTPQQYQENLAEIVRKFREMFSAAELIFATSTPVEEEMLQTSDTYGRLVRRNIDIDNYNKIAVSLMECSGVQVNDLNALMKQYPATDVLNDDGTHHNENGRKILGEAVSRVLEETLSQRVS